MKRLYGALVASVFLALQFVTYSAAAADFATSERQTAGEVNLNLINTEVTLSDEEIDKTINYWTEERIAKAFKNEMTLDVMATNEADGQVAESIIRNERYVAPRVMSENDGAPVRPDPGFGAARSGMFITDESATAVGKLTMTLGGVDYSCSASFVNSPSKAMIVSAAHCVHEGKTGGWATNVMFFPAHSLHGSTQGYPVGRMLVPTAWTEFEIEDGNMTKLMSTRDVSVLSINESVLPDSLKNPVNKYGGFGFGFGHSGLKKFDARIFVYPKSPGDAIIPQVCSTNVSDEVNYQPLIHVFSVLKAECAAGNSEGASGGPWLQLYDSSKQTGWINGVSSSRKDGWLYSPIFDDTIYSLYTDATQSGM